GDEAAVGLLRPRDLATRLGREHPPDVADIDAHLLEHRASHEACLAPSLKAVPRGLGPAARFEPAHRLERLEGAAEPRLQVAEIRGRARREILVRAHDLASLMHVVDEARDGIRTGVGPEAGPQVEDVPGGEAWLT